MVCELQAAEGVVQAENHAVGPPELQPEATPLPSDHALSSSPADEMLRARWVSSLHEVGHVLAGVLLMNTTSRAMVFSGGGGVASIGSTRDVPQSEEEAIAVAAGEAAESLARRYSWPQVELKPCLDVEQPEAAQRITTPTVDGTRMSDEVAIARWCIEGRERWSSAWKRRFEWLEDRAYAFVKTYEREIVALAEKLFVWGVITLPAEPAEKGNGYGCWDGYVAGGVEGVGGAEAEGSV